MWQSPFPRFSSLLCIGAVALLSLFPVLPAQASDVQGIRVYAAPDSTRLVFDLDGVVEHRIQLIGKEGDKPERLVIEIDNTALVPGISVPDLSGTSISQMRFIPFNDFNLRVELDLKTGIVPKSFILKPSEPYGHRLVVDLVNREAAKPVEKTVVTQGALRDILVVIDAGHGGEDPGALGPNHLREKDITLKIAKQLAGVVNSQPGYHAELTRKGDYFIELRGRSKIAQEKGADLFVSIHADAFKNKNAAGASVFAWSQRGSTSETARYLADKENLSDLVGGADPHSVDDTLVQVLADLQLEGTVRLSLGMGKSVLKEIDKIAGLHKQHVEQAGFMVLKSVNVPSLLVETGFISNPREAENLNNADYEEKLAKAIFTGIDNYFNQIPPPGTYVAARKSGQSVVFPANHSVITAEPAVTETPVKETKIQSVTEVKIEPKVEIKIETKTPVAAKKPVVHVVKRGETLSGIATRYNTTIGVLKKHNKLKSSRVLVGQKLKIPA